MRPAGRGQNRIHEAGPEGIARIAADYAVRLNGPESSEQQAAE
ncbi:hypothetical protein [Streptomyces puniciscabiei]